MDRVISIISLIIAGLFFIYGILGLRQIGSLTKAFLNEECIKKSYIYKVQLISSLITSAYSIWFVYLYKDYNISPIMIILPPIVYFLMLRIFIIIFDYINIRRKKK